jgi:hypothetical protein
LTLRLGYYILITNKNPGSLNLTIFKIMLDIGIGFSHEENPVLACEEAIKQAKSRLSNSAKIGLGLVFNSSDFSSAGVAKTFNTSLNNVPLVGASGSAIITGDAILKHGIVVLLLGFPEDAYCSTAAAQDLTEKSPFECGKELAEKLLSGFKNIPRNFGLLFFDRLIAGGPNFISGLQENLGKSFPCVGASLSGGQYDSAHSALYLNEEVLTNSCTGIIWGGKITFGLGIKHGWKPLGKPHLVSSAIGNIINSIDEKPAIELYREYLGYAPEKLKTHLKKFSVSYPIGVFIPGEEEHLLRNVVSVDERGALICQGSIPEGSTIRLMISTKDTCLAAATQAVKEAIKNLQGSFSKQSNARNSRFAIVFSSISRYNLLRRDIQQELDSIKDGLGGIPFLGIYTHGELAPSTASGYRGQTYFHNQDFSILIIEG